MTLPGSGNPIGFNQIRGEFGNGTNRVGQYRRDDPDFNNKTVGDLENQPLDTGIPTGSTDPIKWSDFYGKSLNVIVDYHSGSNENRPEHGHDRYSASATELGKADDKWTTIGGFKDRPVDSSGTKVKIHVNKTIGSETNENEDICALRTGAEWGGTTILSVDVGDSGAIYGAGGKGGNSAGTSGDSAVSGNPGGEGNSALGIQYGTDANETTVNVNSGGLIICGYGGGGAGCGAEDTDDEGFLNFEDEDAVGSGGPGGGGAGLPAGAAGSNASGGSAASAGALPNLNAAREGGTGGAGGGETGQAVGGTGGQGGDTEVGPAAGGTPVDGEASGRSPGAAGESGSAIRKSSASIKWAFGTNAGNVMGSTAEADGVS